MGLLDLNTSAREREGINRKRCASRITAPNLRRRPVYLRIRHYTLFLLLRPVSEPVLCALYVLLAQKVFFQLVFEGAAAGNVSDPLRDVVPDGEEFVGEVGCAVCWDLGLRESVGVGVGDVMLVPLRVAGRVVVDLCGPDGVVVVFRSVELGFGMDEGVHEEAHSVGVEVGEVEYVQFAHEWGGVRAWRPILDESDDSLLGSDERLHVYCVGLVRAPDGNLTNQVWEDVTVVQLLHCVCGE